MEMSIGDVFDRYTICQLKSERLSLDFSSELRELSKEIGNYSFLGYYIEKLYKINSAIWDLESDIRKGNEGLLGLEEVGRRALKIRDFNNYRVFLKNEINSKLGTGFIDVKMNHSSQKDPEIVISLTTVPERLSNEHEDGIKHVIKSLCTQTNDNYEVHFNIPYLYEVTKTEYILPVWLDEYKLKYPHLKVFRTKDYGPPTKFVPTLERVSPETIILVVDDDLIYHHEMVNEHLKFQKEYMDSVICYSGDGCVEPKYFDLRDSWLISVDSVREADGLQQFKSVSYKRKLFNDDFFENYLGRTFSDDILVSRYFKNNKIKIYVVPFEIEKPLFDTKENWDKFQGVTTFPVLRHSHSISDTGCNKPEILAIEPKFYEPKDLGKKLN